jgi:glycerol-3-phosphate dehydrogenase
MSDGLTHGRRQTIDRLGGDVDLLIIGGGIVGSGIARDAAMRGLRTVVVDQYDFAFGTSSRSSRLLHGGLRYLAQGRIGLVREASVEKVTLAKIAPHLAQPLPFVFPTYKKNGWPRWKLRIGVKVYDLLCSGGNLGRSRGLSPAATVELLPGVRTDRLTGGVRYFDGLTNDARLVLDTLRSAAAAGASAVNYLALTSAERDTDGWMCQLRDGEEERTIPVRARTVVNAAGAWATRLKQSRVRLRLTKGIHIVIDRGRLPVDDAVVMTEGKRILFVIPWGQRVILGTTDTDYDGPTDSPDCTDADVAYVLGVTNTNFPAANLSSADVISAWSGLRPLIADPHGRPSDISRAHQIAWGESGWLDVAGGKLTTYRLMAEQSVDRIFEYLGRASPACRTAEEPILAASAGPTYSGIVPPAVAQAAVMHFCQNEWARHLDDVMIRRTSWRYYHREHRDLARQVAGWMAAALEWSPARTAEEIERYERMTASLAATWQPQPTAGGAAASDEKWPGVAARAAS